MPPKVIEMKFLNFFVFLYFSIEIHTISLSLIIISLILNQYLSEHERLLLGAQKQQNLCARIFFFLIRNVDKKINCLLYGVQKYLRQAKLLCHFNIQVYIFLLVIKDSKSNWKIQKYQSFFITRIIYKSNNTTKKLILMRFGLM